MCVDRSERNIIEAVSAGASASVTLVGNIAANLIAFLAILHFINSTLTWFGRRVGAYGFHPPDHEDITIEVLLLCKTLGIQDYVYFIVIIMLDCCSIR